jgi:outer membrane immunogenic protein
MLDIDTSTGTGGGVVKRRVLTGLAALTLLDISAATAQAQNWNGAYVGIHGGYRWADVDFSAPSFNPGFPDPVVPARSESYSPDSWIVGGHVGYNLVTSGNLLFGIEGDLTYGDGSDSKSASIFSADGVVTRTSRAEMNWQGTIRGRLGVINGPTVFYATVGVAFADVEWSETATFSSGTFSVSRSDTLTGLVAGGGVELALNRNWIVRGEYLYEDFGSMRVPLAGPTDEHGTLDTTAHKLRIGVSFLLGARAEPLK